MAIEAAEEIAEDLGVKNYKKLSKKELIYKILDQQAVAPEAASAAKEKAQRSKSFWRKSVFWSNETFQYHWKAKKRTHIAWKNYWKALKIAEIID